VTEITDQPATTALREKLRKWFVSRGVVRACWIVNGLLLVATLIWILRDGQFAAGLAAFQMHVSAFVGEKSPLAVVPPLMWSRVDALWVILFCGTISMTIIIVGLAVGSGIHRGTRAWLMLMLLVAGWLTLITAWPEIAWRGQVWRVRGSVSQFAELTQKLTANWPQSDGQTSELGGFMAYPIGNPRTLMLLTMPQVPGSAINISTVERGDDGTWHFQLAGNDEGAWVVFDNQDDSPQPFFSGLEGEYLPRKYATLVPGWFLVQYQYAPILPDAPMETTPVPRR
jgi:hypothetical protein